MKSRGTFMTQNCAGEFRQSAPALTDEFRVCAEEYASLISAFVSAYPIRTMLGQTQSLARVCQTESCVFAYAENSPFLRRKDPST